MLGLWTANHGVAWKNRKNTVFNNVPLLDYKYVVSFFLFLTKKE